MSCRTEKPDMYWSAPRAAERPVISVAEIGYVRRSEIKAATTTISIIFTTGGDPVGAGLVPNLNRPGGNCVVCCSDGNSTKRRIEPVLSGLLIEVKRTAMLRHGNSCF
jgi:ABC-type uncharacterized transport system substrate-binding protein